VFSGGFEATLSFAWRPFAQMVGYGFLLIRSPARLTDRHPLTRCNARDARTIDPHRSGDLPEAITAPRLVLAFGNSHIHTEGITHVT
jgi:hypothetical protein